MSAPPVIRVENLWKQYRLGIVSHATLQQDLQSWWARFRGQEDPNQCIDVPSADLARYGEHFWALREISFDVGEGDVLGIIGRNGAGKSTLLKILSQVTAPSRGQIKIRGRIASLLEVGTGFHPELTGRENIFLNGAILGMSKLEIRRKLDEIIAFSEVEKFIDTPVKRYSSGMYVRLAFAVAAHLEPEILVVDEVLAVGDSQFQRKCLGKMKEVGEEGRTILFVSHNMGAVKSLCRKTLWLDEGSIRAHGQADQVVDDYLGLAFATQVGQEWTDEQGPPCCAEAIVRRIGICSTRSNDTGLLTISEPLTVEVDVESLQIDQDLGVTLHFACNDGTIAFSTSSLHVAGVRGRTLGRGVYRFTCHVPQNLLNVGRYTLNLLLVKNQARALLRLDQVLVFEMNETRERPSAYLGKRPGVVAPLLDWSVINAEC
jgi:homopolymeric O-antigen transport system ATP-binding protein